MSKSSLIENAARAAYETWCRVVLGGQDSSIDWDAVSPDAKRAYRTVVHVIIAACGLLPALPAALHDDAIDLITERCKNLQKLNENQSKTILDALHAARDAQSERDEARAELQRVKDAEESARGWQKHAESQRDEARAALAKAEAAIANAWKALDDEPDDASDVEELASSIRVERDYTRELRNKELAKAEATALTAQEMYAEKERRNVQLVEALAKAEEELRQEREACAKTVAGRQLELQAALGRAEARIAELEAKLK